MDNNTYIERDLEERMLKNEKCKYCVFFHLNDGFVDPKIKCYCFFAYDCLIGNKHRFISKYECGCREADNKEANDG